MVVSCDTDVLVIGSGLAGLRATLGAAANGADTLLVSKTSVGLGCNSALAGGGFSVAAPGFSVEDHMAATLQSGKNLNDRDLVVRLAKEAPKEIEFLQAAGVPMSSHSNGYRVKSAPDRTAPSGLIVMRKMTEAVRRADRVRVIPHLFVAKLLVEDNAVTGAVGLGKDGRIYVISSKATVLATGGAGALYWRHDNAVGALGDGYALAVGAGLSLSGMEFVQFYPLALAEPGLPRTIIFPPIPEEGRMVDGEGNDLLAKHNLGSDVAALVVTLRDRAAYAIYKESMGGGAWLDYTRMPAGRWGEYPFTLLPMDRFDFRRKPFRIAPAAHFFMGGVKISPSGQTAMDGLFAAGEAAAGLHGANRMGGNALSECLVFGAASGLAAARFAASKRLRRTAFDAEGWVGSMTGKGGDSRARERISSAIRSMRDVAWRCAGPVRNAEGMRQGLSRLEEIGSALERVAADSVADLVAKVQAAGGLSVLKTVIDSSLARSESIGAFQRDDLPA